MILLIIPIIFFVVYALVEHVNYYDKQRQEQYDGYCNYYNTVLACQWPLPSKLTKQQFDKLSLKRREQYRKYEYEFKPQHSPV